MTAEIIPFDFEEHAVRVIMRGADPWFVAADVCRVLEIGNPWTELMLWLEEHRALNLKLGGNDDVFMTTLVYLTLINALPAAQEGRT